MAITNLPTALTSAGNQGDAGDYSTAASSVFQIDYSGLDYTPKTTDDYKNDFEEELQVFINGIRIYRTATDTGIDDAGGLSTAQKSRLTNLNNSFGNEPWDIVTGTKKVQINQNHTVFGDSDSNNPGYPDLSTWTIIKVIRIKPDKTALATDFQSASVLTEAELDNAFSETFHMAQEAIDTSLDSIVKGADNVWDAQSLRIKNVATPVNANDAVNKGFVDQNGNVSTVAGLSTEIALLGTSEMATATTGHIPVLANVVEQTVNYTVTVQDNGGNKFHIQGGEYGSATSNPVLTLIRGYTYVFDVSNSAVGTSVAGHPLVFMNGSSTLGTSDGVTTTGTAGQAGAKVTVVVSDSVTITKYSCSTHGDNMGNTITLRHDDFKEVADIASNVTSVAGIASNVTTVANNSTNINTVAGISANVTTVASNDSNITSVAGNATNINAVATNATNVNNVGSNIANVNSVATNISQVTTFADTYHTAGTTEPSGSNVTEGDLWFDTANDVLKVYDGSSWGSASSSIATVASQNEFTASNGQGTDNKYFAIVHDVGLELVFLNGVRLKRGSDYYCTNSNTSTTPIASGNAATFVRLETVPGSSDILSIMAFGQIANNLAVNTAGGAFTGTVTLPSPVVTNPNITFNTGSNTFTMPTTRGSDNYVLTRDDTAGTGGTAWKETISAPSITNVSGEINEDTNTTLTVTGNGFASGMTIKLINSTSGADITGHTTLSYTGSSSPITVTIPSATTSITAGTSVKLHISKQGLTTTSSQSIVVSEDPNWVSPADSSTIATIYSNTGTNVNVGSALSATAGAGGGTINYVIDSSDTSATTYFDLGLTSGQITTDASADLDNILGGGNGPATETFIAYAQIAGEEATKKTPRTFNIIVNKAPTGGDDIWTYQHGGSGTTYRIHIFRTTGTTPAFECFNNIIGADILIVGGGGAGGNGLGGGGAGAVVQLASSYTITSGSHDIVVGAGAGVNSTGNEVGGSGSASTFHDGTQEIKALGGGGGAGEGKTVPAVSGNPATNFSNTGGTSYNNLPSGGSSPEVGPTYTGWTAYHNKRGGGGLGAPQYASGGGAGADGIGITGSTNGGNGGVGIQIAWATPRALKQATGTTNGTALDTGFYWAGGGGGSVHNNSNTSGKGHHGGGGGAAYQGSYVGSQGDANAYNPGNAGNNGVNSDGGNAGDNTGGGGGGGTDGTGNGGAGGSGIVVIRYEI